MVEMTGTNAPDVLLGTKGDDTLLGYRPDRGTFYPYDNSPRTDADRLYGRAGNDTLDGGNGTDQLYGGIGHDMLAWASNGDRVYGGHGNDGFALSLDWVQGAALYGGAGIDTLYLNNQSIGPTSVFAMPDAHAWASISDGSRLIGIEQLSFNVRNGDCTVFGGAFSDTLAGEGSGTSDLFGGGGDDQLRAEYAPGTTLHGGAGNDSILIYGSGGSAFGDAGDDSIARMGTSPGIYDGGAGIDTISLDLSQVTTGAHVNLRAGSTLLLPDQTVLTGFERYEIGFTSGDDSVIGSALSDMLNGSDGDDVLHGGHGDDRIEGGLGRNTLSGGFGSDTLSGWGGSGELFGGMGGDQLDLHGTGEVATGGLGADVFKFAWWSGPYIPATILDFSARDVLIFERASFADLPFLHLSPDDFVHGTTARDASDRLLYDIATGTLRYDRDGSGSIAADVLALLTPGTALTAADILIL